MAIAQGTGEELKEHEPEDRFLGRLKHKGVEVHKIAVEELKKNCYGEIPKPTDLHRDLLKLYPESMAPRIVTTNFDTLFEQAGMCLFVSRPEVFTSPALPQGGHFAGIVHVHGVLSRPQYMVLTDADFGRAYLTEGWARRFLVDVFRSYTVLFVGYRHNDTIMNYLSRALPVDQTESRFALTHETNDIHWQYLGIEPITYVKSSDNDHGALYRGVNGLAKNTRRSILDWKREITEIAANPPPLDEEEIDLIDDALKDPVKTRFFTNAATSVEWVDWLDTREYLDGLFQLGEFSEKDHQLAQWLSEKFACDHANELFLLIGRHYMQVNPTFWLQLCRTIGASEDATLDCEILSQWVSLLLATAPAPYNLHLIQQLALTTLAKRCNKCELMENVIDIFDLLSANCLVIKRGFTWPDADQESPPLSVDVEVAQASDHNILERLWRVLLQPKLASVAVPLLASVIERLKTQHRMLCAWQAATRVWNPASFGRTTIESSEKVEYGRPIDLLIDAARDCLEWQAFNRPETAVQWCDRLASEESPLLRRLAAYTILVRSDLNPSGKIDWLLSRMNLHDPSAHIELLRVLEVNYPGAANDQRRAVIGAVLAFCASGQDVVDSEYYTAREQFRWLDMLHNVAPDCIHARKGRVDLVSRYPNLGQKKDSDIIMPTIPVDGWSGHQSPWSVEELMSRPSSDWKEKLLSFQQTEPFGPDRIGLYTAVSEAAKRKLKWGCDLANALASGNEWDTDLWVNLIRAWSEMDLGESEACDVIRQLQTVKLQKNFTRPIADFLYSFVRDGDTQLEYRMLPQANEIATNLRQHLEPDRVTFHFDHWLTRARNHTAGILAYFWLHSLDHWRSQQEPRPNALNEVYRNAFSSIVKDETVLGRLGRSVLARHFSFLLASDDEWTKSNVIPLFSNYAESEDYMAVWDGFLYGSLSSTSAELMKGAVLEALSRIVNDPLNERQNPYVRRYITMLAYHIDDPQIVWIPRFFEQANEQARISFALNIGDRLSDMSGVQQQEWWERWLKLYWTNRVKGVPKALDGGEVESMLRWLPNLEAVFGDAVDLAVRMPTKNAKHDGEVLHRIIESDLYENQPESVAKFLIYLGKIGSENLARSEEKRLIDMLGRMKLSNELAQGLEELAATRGFG